MGTSNSLGNYSPGKPSIDVPPSIIILSCDNVEKLYINIPSLLVFKVQGISEKDLGGAYSVRLKPSDSNIKLFDSKKQEKYNFEVEKGWRFKIYVGGSSIVKNGKIDVFVDDILMLSFPISILQEKDVFLESDVKRLKDELIFIQPFATKGTSDNPNIRLSVPREYQENYCMQAAERSLSELLLNYTSFYSVDRSHNHRNKIGFSGKTAIDRGNAIKANGFVKSTISFNGYSINQNERKAIIDSSSYGKSTYTVISFANGKEKGLYKLLYNDLKNLMGFHVYYFTVTGGYHTLILVIDYRDPCNAKYAIYDEYFETTSNGKFEDVSEGILRQTSWTFASSTLNRFNNKKQNSWDSTETTLWKIQRK